MASHVIRIRLPPVDTLIAIAIVVFAVSWRTWAVLQWTFQGDDWTFVEHAVRLPFLRFIAMEYNGHLLAGQFALVWLVSRAAPLNYAAAVAPLLILSLVTGFLIWKFLNTLFGYRPGNLVPLAVFMLCPLSVPPTLWWAAALTIIPLQFFIVATLFVVLIYVRDPSMAHLVSVGLTYGGAVIFWQKALLILPLAVLFVALFLGEGTGAIRIQWICARLWRLWAVLAGITVAYVSWYASVASGVVVGQPTVLQLERLAAKTLGSTIIPTFLGGPWLASSLGKAFVHELPLPARIATWSVAAFVIGLSLFRYRQAWRGWTLLLAYIAMSTALVAMGRLPLIGAASGLGSRYYADSVAVFAIALALAFMTPFDRQRDPGWSPRSIVFHVGLKGRRPHRSPAGRQGPTQAVSFPSRRFALVAILAYAVSALITSFQIAEGADVYSAKDWFARVRAGVEEHPTASVVDGFLPARAAPPSLEQARLSRVLAPISPRIRWNAPDERPLIFDSSGRILPVQVGSATVADPGPLPGCGYLTSGEPVTTHFHRSLFAWNWGVSIRYEANSQSDGFVTVDGARQSVWFLRGSHDLVLFHQGTATSVTIEATDARVCVASIRVGLVRPRGLPGH